MSLKYRELAAVVALIGAIAALAITSALGHGGAIEVNEGGTKGPVVLTPEQVIALGLMTAPADMRPLSRLLRVHGELAPLTEAQAIVSLRISGNIQAIYANAGDLVQRGQRLALVQSRVVGNPPPVVTVTAPITGVVDTRDVAVGQSIEPDTTLFHLSDHRRMRVVGKVYEEDLGQVKVGQKVFVKLLAFPKELLIGVLSFVGPTLDAETRTVDVWILLDNAQGLLKPNLFARADIVVGENLSALAVPNTAILEANGEKFVFIHQGQKYARVEVAIGLADDQYSEILSGLVPGDEVVTQGAREVYTMWLTGGRSSNAGSD